VQIVKLRLDHLNCYCPVTGEPIFNEDEGLMLESPALKGYWVNLTPSEPYYVSLALTERWKDYLSSVHKDNFLDVAEFLTAIDEPNWVAFECEYVGVSGDTGWIVIDMNYDVNVELW
jgi:hypothetical protein